MKINRIKWKNFNSYGNKEQEIILDYDSSFTLLMGLNGSGKSTIVNVITYGLYGKLQNKNLKDLPNRLNKNLYVEIELEANNKKINIKRGISPNIFEVDVENHVDIKDKAGKVSVQDYLENELYGIPFNVFNNIISISINDFKSFIKMTPKDKRDIIDKIFGLNIINKMSEYLKKDIKKNKEEQIELDTTISVLKSTIINSKEELQELKDKIVQKNNERINELLSLIQNSKKELNKYNAYKKELTEKKLEIDDKINKIYDVTSKYKNTIKSLNEKIYLYNESKCPTCGGDLTSELHKDLCQNYINERDEYTTLIEKLNIKDEKHSSNLIKIKNESNKIKDKIYDITSNINSYDKEYNILNISSDSLNINEQTESINNIINNADLKIENTIKVKEKREREFKFYKILEEILGEKGVKQYALSSILPNLNYNINKMLKILKLDFKLVFNEEFDAKILHLGQEINSYTLSQGENKKLEFAVLVSIIKLLKIKFPGLNVLFLDEIFASLDVESISEVLIILSELSKENNFHIFVVHHSQLDSSYFTQKIIVSKQNNFSQLSIEKV